MDTAEQTVRILQLRFVLQNFDQDERKNKNFKPYSWCLSAIAEGDGWEYPAKLDVSKGKTIKSPALGGAISVTVQYQYQLGLGQILLF